MVSIGTCFSDRLLNCFATEIILWQINEIWTETNTCWRNQQTRRHSTVMLGELVAIKE